MPTPSPDPRRPAARPAGRRLGALVLALGLAAGGSSGCALLRGDDVPQPAASASASAAEELQDLLDRQARAVRRGDRQAYAATLVLRGETARSAGPAGPSSAARRRALRLFDGLSALPLARYRLRLDPATLVLTPDGGALAEVTTELQLDGFDAVPVHTPALVRFAPGWSVASVRDASWARAQGIGPQPWDVARIGVRRGDGVLVVTDPGSAPAAGGLVAAAEGALADVAARVPVPWDRTVVVYALSTTDVLAGLAEVPGGDPEQLDGVSVPVRAERASGPLASTRVVLHPRMVDRDAAGRDRLLRHELVHVALGDRDDRLPTWLAEGIAEWVSVQPLAPAERTIARDAVEAAREGVDALPGDEDFNGPASGANYGIAWHAVEHLVATYGEEALWGLVDTLRARGGDPETVERALRELTGEGSAALASAAGTRIVTTFG